LLAVADGSGGDDGTLFPKELVAYIKKAVDEDPTVRLPDILAGTLRHGQVAG